MNQTTPSRRPLNWLLVAGLLLAAPTHDAQAHEQEETLAEAAVPKAVVAAAKKKYPGASVIRYERESDEGKTLYEVKMKQGERQFDAKYTAEGTLIEEEEILREADLPPAVRAAFKKSPQGKAPIHQVERVAKPGKNSPPIYEIEVLLDGKKIELVYDASGAFLGQE